MGRTDGKTAETPLADLLRLAMSGLAPLSAVEAMLNRLERREGRA